MVECEVVVAAVGASDACGCDAARCIEENTGEEVVERGRIRRGSRFKRRGGAHRRRRRRQVLAGSGEAGGKSLLRRATRIVFEFCDQGNLEPVDMLEKIRIEEA